MPQASSNDSNSLPTTIYYGKGVSQGIAIGKVKVLTASNYEPEVYAIEEQETSAEIARFERALDLTKQQLLALVSKVNAATSDQAGNIFEAHIVMLDDPLVTKSVRSAIVKRQQNAEYVFFAVMQNHMAMLQRISDPYIAERIHDINDLTRRVLNNFNSESAHVPCAAELERHTPHLIIAHNLSPSDTASLDTDLVLGFVSEIGSANSHTAILARSLGIPAIVGIPNILQLSQARQMAVIDGYRGELILNPDEQTLEYYRSFKQSKDDEYAALADLKGQQVTTRDGKRVILAANVEFTHEFSSIQEVGAEGVGLFRSEFVLLHGKQLPSEEQQLGYYEELIKTASPHRSIIRTLDAGGDKLPANKDLEAEPNPFLGWRGIRVSLSCKDLFKCQLRAILRAAVQGPCGIMFPMISDLEQVMECKALVEECKRELESEGLAYGQDIKIGIMIEIPSAALIAEELAEHVDFFSIGTNDLTQYCLAVDRVNPLVADLFRTTHPSVVRMIRMTIEAGRKQVIPTTICGEMAADLELLPLLIGLDVDELSVGAHILPVIRKAIFSLDYTACRELAESLRSCASADQILAASRSLAQQCYPQLLQ